MTPDTIDLPNMAHGQATVTVDRLHVRVRPTTASERYGVLIKDQVVDVWALVDDWALVQAADGLTGWSAARYLKLSSLVRSVAVEP